MPRNGARDLAKEQFWRDVIQQWRSSGESSPAFCQRHGYKYHQFQDWKKLIPKRDAEVALAQRKSSSAKPAANQFSEKAARNKQPKLSTIGFAPARLKDSHAHEETSTDGSKIEIVLTCGIVVRSTLTCSARVLSSVVSALENR